MTNISTIVVAGFQHETNTFAPHRATYEDFVKADSWPALTRADDMFSTMDGLNLPISGFIQSARLAGHILHPVLWASAEPSSYVTEHAFETITSMICDSLSSIDHLDAVYLDLHGAMVTEHLEDGEGELLSRVRAIIGPDKPVIISLDLHANITEQMLEHATAMAVFRTYPHLDMAETGARAFTLMQSALNGSRLVGVMRKIPFLFPLTSQCTDLEPCKSIYQQLPALSDLMSTGGNVDFAAGFPPADIRECGAAIVAYGSDAGQVKQIVDSLYEQVVAAESLFDSHLYSVNEAVRKANSVDSGKPVVLADAQDNPGAGATSDTTGLLQALLDNGANAAVLAVIYDPEVAALAHEAGVGSKIDCILGGKSGFTGSPPFSGRFLIQSLGDGHFTFTGAMYKNSVAQLGPMALLNVIDDNADVSVIVGSQRVQCLDLAIFRHLGIEPAKQGILAVKSSVHFRADFEPIASDILIVASPGAHPCELENLTYDRLREGVRLGPRGPAHVRH